MVELLNSFASEVTRVAREVGTEGKLGGQAQVKGVAGVWGDLTNNVNFDGVELDEPGAQHRRGHDRGGQRRPLAHQITVEVRGEEILASSRIRSTRWWTSAGAFVRVRGHARGARGRHGRQARRPGAGERRGRYLEGPHGQRELHGLEPDRPGAQHRRGHNRRRQRETCSKKITVEVKKARSSSSRTRSTPWSTSCAQQISPPRSRASPRGVRHRGQARRPGRRVKDVAGVWKDLTDSVNSMANKPDQPGAQYRRGRIHDRGRQREPVERRSPFRRARRDPPVEGHDQHHGRPAQRVRLKR